MSKVIAAEAPAVDGKPVEITIKNFRSNADIENYYRYIHDNGLRREAFMLMEYAISKISKAKKSKKNKTLQ